MKLLTKVCTSVSIAALLTMTSCTDTETGTHQGGEASFSNLRSESFIDLPSAIAEKSGGRSIQDEQNEAAEIYEGVRDFVGLADEIVHDDEWGIVSQIEFWRDELDWGDIEKVGAYTYTNDIEGYSIKASFDSTITFSYGLEINALQFVENNVALKIAFNGDFDNPAGEIYYNVGLLDDAQDESFEVLVTFSENSSEKVLDISIVNNAPTSDEEEVSTMKLSLKEIDNVIHMSGCATFPNLTDVTVDVIGHSYIFTGKADFDGNQAIIKLGLPHTTYANNDDALFTTYGVAEVYIDYFMAEQQDELDDEDKAYVVTSYTKNLTIEEIYLKELAGETVLLDASVFANMTKDDLVKFLYLNKNITDVELRIEFAVLLWIAELTQPVYFNNLGYAGNGEVAPAEFATLASIESQLDAFIPAEITNLTIQLD